MKRTRDLLPLSLMACSLLLLVVLQGLWIMGAYEKALFNFERETNYLFRTTVLGMRDAQLAKGIRRVDADSLSAPVYGTAMQRTMLPALPPHDTASVHMIEKGASIQVYVNTVGMPEDSVENYLRPLTAQLKNAPRQKFMIRLGPDTLNVDTLRLKFGQGLDKAGINTPFEVRHLSGELRRRQAPPGHGGALVWHKRLRVSGDTVYSEFVQINPVDRYNASFPQVRAHLLGQIYPQVLFSFFLTAITAIAFLVMYRSIRAQRQLVELKNDFIGNVTHELKTPVATVSVALEALQSFQAKDNPKLAADYLEIARNELARLTEMTDKILKTSVLESHPFDADKQPVALDATIQRAIDAMKPLFEKRSAAITYVKEGSNFAVHGADTHLFYAISNLLDNALKYSPRDPTITVALRRTNEAVILSVHDRGLGIDEQHQQKIFEKFYRVPTGNVHTIKGYGLGLSYVTNVVKHHGGRIELESAPGEGSTFTLTFQANTPL